MKLALRSQARHAFVALTLTIAIDLLAFDDVARSATFTRASPRDGGFHLGPPSIEINAAACVSRLQAQGRGVRVASHPALSDKECSIAEPVYLESVRTMTGVIDLPARPLVACGFAEAFASFVGDLWAPLANAHFGAQAISIATGPGYSCRGRNRIAGAKVSAHGRGLALDMTSMKLSDGRVIMIKPSSPLAGDAFWAALRRAACGWFTTVLGPGSDAAHADHIHFDIEPHGSSGRYRICQ